MYGNPSDLEGGAIVRLWSRSKGLGAHLSMFYNPPLNRLLTACIENCGLCSQPELCIRTFVLCAGGSLVPNSECLGLHLDIKK